MVTHSGAAARSSALRALNSPLPLAVKQRTDGQPAAVLVRRRWMRVQAVQESWRLDDEWWSPEPVARLYYQVELEQIGAMVLFQDLLTNSWFRQQA